MEIIKVASLGFFISLLYLTLKKNQPSLALLLVLAGNLVVLSLALRLFSPLVEWVNRLGQFLSEESFRYLLKALGIALIAQLAQELCKDAGTHSLAFSVELCGRLLVVLVMLPMLSDVLAAISGWLL